MVYIQMLNDYQYTITIHPQQIEEINDQLLKDEN